MSRVRRTAGTGPTVINVNAYEPGLWRRLKVGTNFVPEYLHNDHLGTLRQTTGTTGTAGASRVFTAFGERLPGSATDRFGYVGAFGYQSHAIPESLDPDTAFPYMHVGARYYDPASGRFLQRDPIGILGGTNVYLYVEALPLLLIDPTGLSFMESLARGFLWCTGGEGHVPVLDPGLAQDIVETVAVAVSFAAPVGATVGVVTATAKTVRVMKNSRIGRVMQRIREYVRLDPPHHGKPPGWDGKWGKNWN